MKLKVDRYGLTSATILASVPLLWYSATYLLDGVFPAPYGSASNFPLQVRIYTWFLLVFLGIFFIRGFYDRIENFFEEFFKVVDISRESYKKLVRDVDSLMAGRGHGPYAGRMLVHLIGGVLAIFVVFGAFLPPTGSMEGSWSILSRHLFWFALGIPVNFFFLGYVAPTAIWHELAAIWGMWKVANTASHRKALVQHPLSPDITGGLHPLGDVSLWIVYTILAPLILVVLGIFLIPIFLLPVELGPGPLVLIVIFLALAFAVFFLPIRSAHEAMRKAKQKELGDIAEFYNSEYDQLKLTLEAKNPESDSTAEEIAARLGKIHQVYDRVNSMTVWPFDERMLLKFSTALGVPIILTVINIVLGRFT